MLPGGRAADLVLRWCRLYTRGLDAEVAEGRRSELASDLFDHRASAAAADSAAIGQDLLLRALLGVPADLSWRTHQRRIARSAREPEVAMPARESLDGWTRAAYGVAAVVIAWSAFVGVRMLLDARNFAPDSEEVSWRIMLGTAAVLMLAPGIHGVFGLRTHPLRSSVELAVAAMVTTVWMLWAAPVAVAGVTAMVFFVGYGAHSRRARVVVQA